VQRQFVNHANAIAIAQSSHRSLVWTTDGMSPAPNLIDAFPISWEAAFTANPRLVNFGIDIAISFGRWLLAQARAAHFVTSVTSLELFIGFYYEVGAVLPVRVGVHRGRERWISVANTNVGALHGRSLGSQLGVIEWLVRVIFSDHLDSDLTFGTIVKPHFGIHIPLKSCRLAWSRGTASLVQQRLLSLGRPIRFNRDLAKAFP
jgi:hypothetical protein